MKKIDIKVPDGQIGNWQVETFEVTEEGAAQHNLRCRIQPGMGHRTIEPGFYKRLVKLNGHGGGATIMSNTPAEIMDHEYFVSMAEGNVLVNGLGLGVVLQMLLDKPEVKHVTVIEKEAAVIALVAPTFLNEHRVDIICADAFTWKPPRGAKYNAVWHDIWDSICADNLDEMKRLHRKYGKRAKWQGSWCRGLCELYA